MNQVVATAAAQVEETHVVALPQLRIQNSVGRRMRPEQAVDPVKIPKGLRQTRIRNGKVVHPLLGL